MLTKVQTKNTKIKMIENNLNQIVLAKKLGISRQYLNLLINGKVENSDREKELKDFLWGI